MRQHTGLELETALQSGVTLLFVLAAGLGTKPIPGFSLGMLAWLRSSSQDSMVAARLASLPLRPTGVFEDVAEGGWASASLFIMDSGTQSATGAEAPENMSSNI